MMWLEMWPGRHDCLKPCPGNRERYTSVTVWLGEDKLRQPEARGRGLAWKQSANGCPH